MLRRTGFDIGGVIIDATANDGTDTDIRGDGFMNATQVPGAFEAVRQVVERYGANNAFVISKCGEFIEGRTREWLAGNGFYDYTGFNPVNLHFCRTRAEKAPIAAELNLSDFVDDHQDVFEGMVSVARHHLFGPQLGKVKVTDRLIIGDDWPTTLVHLLSEM